MLARASVATDDWVAESSDHKVSPVDNVYSYFMFMLPVEEYLSRRQGGSKQNIYSTTAMAYLIVFLSFFLQGVLLYAIMKETVLQHMVWRDSVYSEKGRCNVADSLCTWDGKMFSCAPPTIQMSGSWEDLDTDADGFWTMEEVKASRDDLKCKFGVDPVEVFDVYQKFLLNREKIIYIEPELRKGNRIPKAYFEYAEGDIIMCSYRSEDMCPNLLKRGIFDKPLADGSVPRVGTTIDDALDYCYGLLGDSGTCVRTLPSTYSVWRRASQDQCGTAEYTPMLYKHPSSSERKSMLSVDYATRQDYRHADKSNLYIIYKSSIIAIYLFAMFFELRDIGLSALWCQEIPTANLAVEDNVKWVVNDDGTHTYELKAISTHHRVQMTIITIARFLMLCVLTAVGLSFLLKETNYIDLLLNGLGLIFVVQISNLCYAQLLDRHMQEKCESILPMKIPFWGAKCLKNDPALRDLCWILLMFVMLVGIVEYNYYDEVAPVTDALKCTCISEGKYCKESRQFDKSFWDKYWMQDLPHVLNQIDEFEKKYNRTAGAAPGPAPAEPSSSSTSATEFYSQRGVESANAFASRADANIMMSSSDEELRGGQQLSSTNTWMPLVGAFSFILGPSWGAWTYIASLLTRPIADAEGTSSDLLRSSKMSNMPRSRRPRRQPVKVINHVKEPSFGF